MPDRGELIDFNTRHRLDQLEHRIETLAGSGGPPYDSGMEARVAKLEAAVEHIQSDLRDIKSDVREVKHDARTDFRLLFGAIITTTLGLAALMAKGFSWL